MDLKPESGVALEEKRTQGRQRTQSRTHASKSMCFFCRMAITWTFQSRGRDSQMDLGPRHCHQSCCVPSPGWQLP